MAKGIKYFENLWNLELRFSIGISARYEEIKSEVSGDPLHSFPTHPMKKAERMCNGEKGFFMRGYS